MISLAPMKPGFPPLPGSGYSSIVPNWFAKVPRNEPRAGSSGITTRCGFVWGTPAASASGGRITAAAGWVPEVWSRATFAGQRSRHASGSIRSGSLCSDRNV
jgi:hypothetical protein